MDLKDINRKLEGKGPIEILEWVFSLEKKIIATTNFGPFEAVMLHQIKLLRPQTQIVWVDTGYNTHATYLFADKLCELLSLNLKVYTPTITARRRDARMRGIPEVDTALHQQFTEQVKLEPFKKALEEIKPDVWLTAIRKVQTEQRALTDIVSMDKKGMWKVAPVLNLTDEDMLSYLEKNNLPNEIDYYDPTKVHAKRECGLHNRK